MAPDTLAWNETAIRNARLAIRSSTVRYIKTLTLQPLLFRFPCFSVFWFSLLFLFVVPPLLEGLREEKDPSFPLLFQKKQGLEGQGFRGEKKASPLRQDSCDRKPRRFAVCDRKSLAISDWRSCPSRFGNTLSTAGNSITSSERPSPESGATSEKRGVPSRTERERILDSCSGGFTCLES